MKNIKAVKKMSIPILYFFGFSSGERPAGEALETEWGDLPTRSPGLGGRAPDGGSKFKAGVGAGTKTVLAVLNGGTRSLGAGSARDSLCDV